MSRRPRLTHLDDSGRARMVDVSSKDRTAREASAEAFVRCAPATVALVREKRVEKGDVIAVARLAGIAGAKQTPQLVPLCHPVALTGVEVDVDVMDDGLHIVATAHAQDRTGVEMEAMTAAGAAALAVYDMLKAAERGITVERWRLLTKSGGRSGTWRR